MNRPSLAAVAAMLLIPVTILAEDKLENAGDSRPSLRIAERSTARFPSADDPAVVLVPVRAVLVKELSIKLVTVQKGTAETISKSRLFNEKESQDTHPVSGHLVLVLKPNQKDKTVEPSLGHEFGTDGFNTQAASGGRAPAVPTSKTKIEFVSKDLNCPSDQETVVYGQMFGSKETKGELQDMSGKPLDEVTKISKQYPHLSYILIVLSWAGPEGE